MDIRAENSVEEARALLLETMDDSDKVLTDQELAVYVTGGKGKLVSTVGYWWVKCPDWFGTWGALWVAVTNAFAGNRILGLALPRMGSVRPD